MTTGPTDGKVTTAAGGPDGMPLALRLSEGLGPDATELDRVLRELDDATNQTWRGKRKRWASLVRAQDAEIQSMRTALIELRDRIKDHPAYADLTEDEEIDCGGDTAEFSYRARVADAALGA